MGAEVFCVTYKGKTAQEAFDKAVLDAVQHYGMSGYTGTIAEKEDFIMIDADGRDFTVIDHGEGGLEWILDEANWEVIVEHENLDKWGPAGCIQVEDDTFIFIGLASN